MSTSEPSIEPQAIQPSFRASMPMTNLTALTKTIKILQQSKGKKTVIINGIKYKLTLITEDK